jgi:hypothetical protein
MLLKGLSSVNLWTTVMAMMGDSDDEKVTKEIKARRPLIFDQSYRSESQGTETISPQRNGGKIDGEQRSDGTKILVGHDS